MVAAALTFMGCGRLGFASDASAVPADGGSDAGDAGVDASGDAGEGDGGADAAVDSAVLDSGPPPIPTRARIRWAAAFGDTGNDRAEKFTADRDGNLYTGGYFEGTIDPGGGDIVSVDGQDGFLVTYDVDGAYRWSRHYAGAGSQRAAGVGIISGDRVAVAGGIEGMVDLGAGVHDTRGTQGLFIAAYALADGAHSWSSTYIGTENNRYEPMSISPAGEILLSHGFVGGLSIGGPMFTAEGEGDVFIGRYTANGAYVDSTSFGGAALLNCEAIVQDAAGNYYASGSLSSADADFGGTTLPGSGSQDAWIASWTPALVLRWAKLLGSAGSDLVEALVVTRAGDVYGGGYFNGPMTIDGETLTPVDQADAFLVRLTSDGDLTWARSFGGTGFDEIEALAIDAWGEVYVGGSFTTSIDVGGGAMASVGGADGYVARLGPDGEHRWSVSFGSAAGDAVRGVAPDGLGNVGVGAYVGGPVDFDFATTNHGGGEDAIVLSIEELP